MKEEESKGIVEISLSKEMKSSYLDYAMSVIVSRALPDVRDGLKPVHRRILYAMGEAGCDWNKPYKKSARVVGEVMGNYHPHGDGAIYDSLVRMAQDFSLRLPLIDGQGNFGSIDGDSPAAMRYTEVRLAKVAHFLLDDIDKGAVDFQDNYDTSRKEPMVLPAKFPNVLVNGAGGIAVGMATNIPPFNLGEIIDACCMYIKNHQITSDDLLEVVHGPDFPTAGIIVGKSSCISAIKTGRGSILMRGKTDVETLPNKKQAIIITEVPYQVNKAKMVEKIAELVRDKKIEGISDLRDESDKSGIRVVVEIKKDVMPEVILNQLFSYTSLQSSFGVNMLALNDGKPEVMNVLDVIRAFTSFRETVISRRIKFLLSRARDKAHLLIGVLIAVNNIDEVVAMIRGSSDVTVAKTRLMEHDWKSVDIKYFIDLVGDKKNKVTGDTCRLTEEQAKAILEMRLQRLTGIEKSKVSDELNELAEEIKRHIEILGSRDKVLGIIEKELLEIKESFATPRRTVIEESELEYNIEDLIQKEDMVVTVTHKGYIKRVPLSTYRAQKRGGKGRSGLSMREEDFTKEMFITNTHTPVLFFSNHGKVYKLKVYKLPMGTSNAKGRALVNIFPLADTEMITNVMPLPEGVVDRESLYMVFATAQGNIRRNSLTDFENVQSNGKIAIRVSDGDSLVGVKLCTEKDNILLSASSGKCVRFPVEAVRVFKSRTSDGVRGIKLKSKDKVVSISILTGSDLDFNKRDSYLRIQLKQREQLHELFSAEFNQAAYDSIMKNVTTDLSQDEIAEAVRAEQFLLTITENGFGKRSSTHEYRITNRGGSGIVNIITSSRNGAVISSFPVYSNDQIMLITEQGTLIRCPVDDIRIAGRNTQGVTIFRTEKEDNIVSVALATDSVIGDDESSEDGSEEVIAEVSNEE